MTTGTPYRRPNVAWSFVYIACGATAGTISVSSLNMLDAVLELVPGARVGHIGLQRDEMTAVASQYYSKLPARLDASYVLMIDPMLATGGSAVAALDLLERAGARGIRIVCI